ncbi:MAG: type II secretion system protein GspL [Geobacteraceae bacterium]|nr:type II secretion system protein GspL [Geobacteraceae bacterium]
MDMLIVETVPGEVCAARYRREGGALLFQGAECRPLDASGDLTAALLELAGSRQHEKRVFLSADAGTIFWREVELPFTDRRKQREVLPLEFKGETVIDSDKLLFDALPFGDNHVLAVWGVEAELREKVDAMAAAGLEPELVGCHLYHWDLLVPASEDGPIALTDGRSLAVFSDRLPILFRSLNQDDALQDIDRTLAMIELGKGIKVDKIFLHGKAARDESMQPGSGQEPCRCLSILPVAGAHASAFPDPGTAVRFAGSWALAAASLDGEPLNFRHGRLAYKAGSERLKKRLRWTMFLFALLAALLIGETGLRFYFVEHDLASLDTSIRKIYREVFPERKKAVDEVSELKAEIQRMGGGATGQSILRVLSGIATAKGEEVSAIYEAEFDGDQVRLKGYARSFQAVADFKTRLALLFVSSEMGEVKSRPDGTVSFVFRGGLGEVAK